MTSAKAVRSRSPAGRGGPLHQLAAGRPTTATTMWWRPRTTTSTPAATSPTSRTTRAPGRRTAWPGQRRVRVPPRAGDRADRGGVPQGRARRRLQRVRGPRDDGTPLAGWLRAAAWTGRRGGHRHRLLRPGHGGRRRCQRAFTRVLLGLTAGVAPGTTAEAITSLSDAGVEVSRALAEAADCRSAASRWRGRASVRDDLRFSSGAGLPSGSDPAGGYRHGDAYRYTPIGGEHQRHVPGCLEQARRSLVDPEEHQQQGHGRRGRTRRCRPSAAAAWPA
jgi:hypothetical protein